jgi:metal-responsive CopG/Arc/MetJ family transcriptional regulator
VARTVDKRKATFLLPSRLLKEVDDAVATGSAASKNAFVEEALDRAIAELRRAQLRDGLQAAMADPLFRRDLEEVERDFRLADAETAREIR